MSAKRKKSWIKLINTHEFQLKRKLFAFFLIFIIIISVYIRYLVTPIIIKNTESQISSFATVSINEAIADAMNQNISYSDLIKIVRDKNDDILTIEANSIKINSISKNLSGVILNRFLNYVKSPIKIPLGSFSGISIFAGFGPMLSYDIYPYGEVLCNFVSRFESAGINQTYHKLYLVISLKSNIVLPIKKVVTHNDAEVLLCETLIIGKIPEFYLNSGGLTDMLNLLPEKFSSWQMSIF